jgi:hypothetical protein
VKDDVFKEINQTIASWLAALDIEQSWPDDLDPADVLEKYIFPHCMRAVEDEREACARVAEGYRGTGRSKMNPAYNVGVDDTARRIADAIHARATPQSDSAKA